NFFVAISRIFQEERYARLVRVRQRECKYTLHWRPGAAVGCYRHERPDKAGGALFLEAETEVAGWGSFSWLFAPLYCSVPNWKPRAIFIRANRSKSSSALRRVPPV